MRIVLMISSIEPGGAERVLTLLADGLSARGHEVSLLTLAACDRDFFPVSGAVRRIGLDMIGTSGWPLQAAWANFRRVRGIRRAVAELRPDVVLSFTTPMNVLAIIACRRLPVRVVVSERIDPESHVLRGAWATLRMCTYRRAAALVTQTQQAAQWFRRRLGERTVVATIANPVARLAPVAVTDLAMPQPFLLAAGRLVDQKGFDVLIRAFAQSSARSDFQLVIAGEGPAEPILRQLAASLGLASRVSLPGKVHSLPALMQRAHAFILSSRYEGFPNVLLEALAAGTPVISTNCPGGPAEILRQGKYGLLVPPEDTTALAAAMDAVTTDSELRSRLASAATQAIVPYDLGSVLAQWEHVLAPQ